MDNNNNKKKKNSNTSGSNSNNEEKTKIDPSNSNNDKIENSTDDRKIKTNNINVALTPTKEEEDNNSINDTTKNNKNTIEIQNTTVASLISPPATTKATTTKATTTTTRSILEKKNDLNDNNNNSDNNGLDKKTAEVASPKTIELSNITSILPPSSSSISNSHMRSISAPSSSTKILSSSTRNLKRSSTSQIPSSRATEREKRTSSSLRLRTTSSSTSRTRSYGDLLTGTNGKLSRRKKEVLMNLIKHLRFEEIHHKNEAGRDFTGPIIWKQFFREFFLFLLYLIIGPFSLIIIIPLIGTKIAKAKLFLPNNNEDFIGGYIRMLVVSISFLCIILHVIVNQGALNTNHIYWSDVFLPTYIIFNYCMLNGLKYGYQDPINYAARKLYIVFVQNVHYFHRTV